MRRVAVTFIERRSQDGVIDGENKLEKFFPKFSLQQFRVFGNALDDDQHSMTQHDVLSRR